MCECGELAALRERAERAEALNTSLLEKAASAQGELLERLKELATARRSLRAKPATIPQIMASLACEYDQGDKVMVWYDDLYDLNASGVDATRRAEKAEGERDDARAYHRVAIAALQGQERAKDSAEARVKELEGLLLAEPGPPLRRADVTGDPNPYREGWNDCFDHLRSRAGLVKVLAGEYACCPGCGARLQLREGDFACPCGHRLFGCRIQADGTRVLTCYVTPRRAAALDVEIDGEAAKAGRAGLDRPEPKPAAPDSFHRCERCGHTWPLGKYFEDANGSFICLRWSDTKGAHCGGRLVRHRRDADERA